MKKNLSSTQRAFLTVLGAFFVNTGSGFAAALSLFYLPIINEYGFSQTALSLYVSLMSICGVFAQPAVGHLLDRFSKKPQVVALGGAALGAVSYVWLSRCTSLPMFYAAGVALSFVVPVVSGLYGTSVVTQWFSEKRSVALSVVTMGTSFGTVLYSQVARYFIDHMGWRAGYLSMGVLIAVMTVIGVLFVSPPPASLGMQPYGWDPARQEEGAEPVSGMTLQEAFRTPGFWIFLVATFSGSAYVMGMQQSIVPMLQVDFQFSAALATTLMSLFSIVCALAKPLMGMIYEKAGAGPTTLLVGVLVSAALILILQGSGLAAAALAMIILGVGNMFGTVILYSFGAEKFGNRAYSSIMGYINIAFALGVSVGPVLAGWIFDRTASYTGTYRIFLLLCIISTVLTLLANWSLKRTNAARAS